MTHNIFDKLRQLLRDADVLLIVPPFTTARMPSLAAHLLQASAARAGFRVDVLYANLILSAIVGSGRYEAICGTMSTDSLVGERFFAAAAYDLPLLGRRASRVQPIGDASSAKNDRISPIEFSRLAASATDYADAVAAAIAQRGYKIVGCTTMYQQTAASVSLLRRLKRLRPDVITIIGGANCEGPMADGIAGVEPHIDFVFSGECDGAFPDFLEKVFSGTLPDARIVRGQALLALDDIPRPSYGDFFEQLEAYSPDSVRASDVRIPYETSRGCWWGEKHHCTFCGLNGLGMMSREKSADRVIGDLTELMAEHPSRNVHMADNIMPHTYFRTLIPRLAVELPNVSIFYEQKSNLSLQRVVALRAAGVTEIQPGIEALSSSLLKRMCKGVSAAQNIALLRYARSAELRQVWWNLLYDFPGDQRHEYEETLAILPLLRHLSPPTVVGRLSIDRFSPYFDHPERYAIKGIRPIEEYRDVFPATADVVNLAYHFKADYASAARAYPTVIRAIKREVAAWRKAWSSESGHPPELSIHRLSDNVFLLRDTRGLLLTEEVRLLDRREATVALVARRFEASALVDWAIEHKLGVQLDGLWVPLATAPSELLVEFEEEVRVGRQTTGAGASAASGGSGLGRVVLADDSRVVVASFLLSRVVSEEIIVFAPRTQRCYGLSSVAARIWTLIRKPAAVRELRNRLVDEYDVEPDRCGRDVLAVLAQLSAQGLIECSGGLMTAQSESEGGTSTGAHRQDDGIGRKVPPKKPYSPPTLIEHGTLTELARKQHSADSGAMSNVIRSFQAFVHTGGSAALAPTGLLPIPR